MRKKFFLKRFRQFFLMMLLPTAVVFFICMFFVLEKGINEIRSGSAFTLESIAKNVEYTVVDSIYQNDMLTRGAKYSKGLSRVLTGRVEEYSDVVFLNSIRAMLNSIVESGTYLDSIYLCLDDRDYFLSSREGIRAIASYYDNTWRALCDQLESKQDILIRQRVIHSAAVLEEKSVISVFRRMLLQKGTLIVNVDAEAFLRMIREEAYDYSGSIVVLDEAMTVLARYDADGEGLDSAALTPFFQAQQAASQLKTSWARLDGTLYYMDVRPFESLRMHFVSMIPLGEIIRAQQSYLLLFLLVFITNCLVVVVLSYITTHRVFKQIHYMVDVFVDADQGIFPKENHQKVNDEYDLIMNNIIHMFLNTTHLNTLLAEKQYRKEAAELMALQLQINPHFLYNTLQTLDFEVARKEQNRELIGQIIQDLSSILKYALSNPHQSVTLAEELMHLRAYVNIQRVRFEDRFVFYVEAEPEVMDAEMFSLLLQPLVENSILHGVLGKEQRGFIRVRAVLEGERLLISVLDNGVGMEEDRVREVEKALHDESSQRIGLVNVHRRLVLHFGEEAGLSLRSRKGIGTRVYFSIPYRKANDDTKS